MLTKSIEYSLSNMSNFLNLAQSEADYINDVDSKLTNFASGHKEALFFGTAIENSKIVGVRNFFIDIGNDEERIAWGVEVSLDTGAILSHLFSTDCVVNVSLTEFDQVIFKNVVKE